MRISSGVKAGDLTENAATFLVMSCELCYARPLHFAKVGVGV